MVVLTKCSRNFIRKLARTAQRQDYSCETQDLVEAGSSCGRAETHLPAAAWRDTPGRLANNL